MDHVSLAARGVFRKEEAVRPGLLKAEITNAVEHSIEAAVVITGIRDELLALGVIVLTRAHVNVWDITGSCGLAA